MLADNLTKYIKTLEWKCFENEQYSRRECLELSGIPGSISDNALEETILGLFSKCSAPVDPSNVEGCHRLWSTNNTLLKVIMKLSKWKDVYRVLKAKPSLKILTLMELEYLLAPLYLSTKVCADIINFYGLNARNYIWIRLLSCSGFQKARVE